MQWNFSWNAKFVSTFMSRCTPAGKHGCCVEFLAIIFEVAVTIAVPGHGTWRKWNGVTGRSSIQALKRSKWSYYRIDSWRFRCAVSRAAGTVGGRLRRWSGLSQLSRSLEAAVPVVSSSAALSSISVSISFNFSNFKTVQCKKVKNAKFLFNALGQIVNQFTKSMVVVGVVDI